jgi:AcrR family transcriptional regulator
MYLTSLLTRYALSVSGRRYADKTADERHDARRDRLIEAALDAFAADGYAGTSIEGLCSRAGVSTRSFYEHFESREEVLLALHDDLNTRALRAAAQAVAAADPDELRARAHAGVRAYFDIVTTDPRWARIAVVESVGVSATAERHRQQALDRFADLVEAEATRVADAGRAPKRDHRLTAVALVGAINGLVNTWTAAPDWGDRVDEVVDVATDIIVAAITRP